VDRLINNIGVDMDDESIGKLDSVDLSAKSVTDEVLGLWKPLNVEDDTLKFIADSSYNNAVHDALMIIYKQTINKVDGNEK